MSPDVAAVEPAIQSQPIDSQRPRTPGLLWRRLAVCAWLALWPLLLALHLFPIRYQSLRMLMLALVVLLWLGGVELLWRRRVASLALLGLGLAAPALLLLPGGGTDRTKLREAYVRALAGYEGTQYVWGGETHTGIDCSGLVRCGLIDASARRGLATLNPRLLRDALSLWWNDCSARTMGQGAFGRARLVTETQAINELDHS
jgi:hypothetical protein